MSGKSWLITGVSGGLGRALALAALARGDRVAGTVRNPAAAAAFAALAPGASHGLVIDLGDTRGIPAMVDEAAARLGRLDVVVNNAGYALAGAVEEVAPAEAEAIMAVNFHAPLAAAQAAMPHLRAASGGRILNISSMAAVQGFRGLGLYCASKAALSALTEVQAIEGRPWNIFATSVEATAFRTDFAGSSMRDAARRLPEHAAMRAEMEAACEKSNGNQPSDPAKGAAALLALSDMADPPVHFALGFNAGDRVEEVFAARLDEYRRYRAMGAETRF